MGVVPAGRGALVIRVLGDLSPQTVRPQFLVFSDGFPHNALLPGGWAVVYCASSAWRGICSRDAEEPLGNGDCSRPSWAIRFFGGILILDLVRYAAHFAFHAIAPLWRVHAIHHSDVDFDITTGLRHHPLEVLLMAGAEFAAIALFAIPASAVFVLSCIVIAHALFSHANASLPPAVERILRLVIVTPQFHEVHHSIDLSEQKANLGNVFPWWDRLFGQQLKSLGLVRRFASAWTNHSVHRT